MWERTEGGGRRPKLSIIYRAHTRSLGPDVHLHRAYFLERVRKSADRNPLAAAHAYIFTGPADLLLPPQRVISPAEGRASGAEDARNRAGVWREAGGQAGLGLP